MNLGKILGISQCWEGHVKKSDDFQYEILLDTKVSLEIYTWVE